MGFRMIWYAKNFNDAPPNNMMTSSNENIFRVTGPLCGEFTGEFPAQRPVMRSFDVFFDLRLDKRFSKQSWGWWFEMLVRPLWRLSNELPWCHSKNVPAPSNYLSSTPQNMQRAHACFLCFTTVQSTHITRGALAPHLPYIWSSANEMDLDTLVKSN